jgi:hypothetical protein
MESTQVHQHAVWNKGKLVGQKAPFKLKQIWSFRVRVEIQGRLRELAQSISSAAWGRLRGGLREDFARATQATCEDDYGNLRGRACRS